MKKFELIPLTFFLALILIASAFLAVYHEFQTKPLVPKALAQGDTAALYQFYIAGDPSVGTRPALGSENAPVTIIGYLAIDSDASQFFVKNIFPELKREFIDSNRAHYYVKVPLTQRDVDARAQRYLFAQSLSCMQSLQPDSYFPFYFDLFGLERFDDLPILLDRYNVSNRKFDTCMQTHFFPEIMHDVSETSHFGFQGLNARFYIGIDGIDFNTIDGIPRYKKFNQTIREFELILGS